MRMRRTLKFAYEKDTKNKYRFIEDSEEPLVGTLYVSKSLFTERPEGLEVTISTTR